MSETVEHHSVSSARIGWLVPLFAAAIFSSATLLFVVQPMVAKAILPLLGGTPAVWNTCMVFFQAVLLAGYLYAHVLVSRFGLPWQVLIHVGLLAAAGLMLPIDVTSAWSAWHETHPQLGVLALLAGGVGLPFLALSATAPLLQAWFARTGHASASDPYFLYAASNAGSMAALLSYPTLTEVFLPLEAQLHLWRVVYWVLAGFLVASGFVALRRSRGLAAGRSSHAPAAAIHDGPLSLWEGAYWVALAFIPSSLMLGLTTYFTTDIASVPLFWVVPLTIYLLTFIIAFSRLGPSVMRAVTPLVPLAVVAVLLLNLPDTVWDIPLSAAIALHLAAFFILALACHTRLAERRPSVRHLTNYYLLMSLGGVLGGIFNALLSPALFNSIFEYPLVAASALPVLLAGRIRKPEGSRWLTAFLLAVAVGTALLAAILAASRLGAVGKAIGPAADALDLEPSDLALLFMGLFGTVLVLIAYRFGKPAVSAGVAVAMAFVGYGLDPSGSETQFRHRSFFGVVRVYNDQDGLRYFEHGTTIHGAQFRASDRTREPLTYYHREGPVGHLWKALDGASIQRIGVVGLGVGTLAAYGKPGQRFTFYEIDPVVARVAEDPRSFTYLSDGAAGYDIVLGDARLKLKNAPDQAYDLLVLDAFSSDAIPVHLISREAFRLYVSKLSRDGVIAINISNEYLNLTPIIANLAADAGLTAYVWDDDTDEDDEPGSPGRYESEWVIMSTNEKKIEDIVKAGGEWEKLSYDAKYPVWKDSYSNILRTIIW